MLQISKAKVFYSGRSRAVRIPAELRFKTDEVYVRRDPQSGDLILSESPVKTWGEILRLSMTPVFLTISWKIETRDLLKNATISKRDNPYHDF